MANPFGDVVDDEKLDGIERYVGKAKTQEDRAREAIHLINEDDKNTKAEKYVESIKSDYGDGVTTLCLVYNATGDNLNYVTDHDWWGNIGRTPYPTFIGNGQYGAFLHVHKTDDASGSEAAVVYRGKNKDGDDRDFMIAWSSPWSSVYRNKAYSDLGVVSSFDGRWDDIYGKVNDSNYSDTTDKDGAIIEVNTATGSSPIFHATIKIPFSP